MPKIAIYTLTRDRLKYTRRMFEQLIHCGMEYDHFILDNGSTDGTPKWLAKQNLNWLYLSPDNKGLWKGIELILQENDYFSKYDFVLKLDNDIEFPKYDWLKYLVNAYENSDFDLLQPFIEGIRNGEGGMPAEGYEDNIRIVSHCAGGCLLCQPKHYDFEMPNFGKALGWDSWFGKGLKCGLVEEIKVKHNTLEQEKEMPEYYERKIKEANEKYD